MTFKANVMAVLAIAGTLTGCGDMKDLGTRQAPIKQQVAFLPTEAAGLVHGMDFTVAAASLTRTNDGLRLHLSDRLVDICGTKQDGRRHSEVVFTIPDAIGEHSLDEQQDVRAYLMFIENASKVPVIYKARVGRVAIDTLDGEGASGKIYVASDDDNFINGTFTAHNCGSAKANFGKETELPARVDFR